MSPEPGEQCQTDRSGPLLHAIGDLTRARLAWDEAETLLDDAKQRAQKSLADKAHAGDQLGSAQFQLRNFMVNMKRTSRA